MALHTLASFQGLRAIKADRRSSLIHPSQRNVCRIRMSAVLPVVSFEGESTGEVELDLKVAKPETAKAVVHRAVVTILQNRRSGTANTKTRAEVRGGGRKPYKQKGTGNARLGSTRTPLRPGGGVIFGPKPKDWSIKINKKENRLALSTALQSAAANIIVVEDFDDKIEAPKTKDFVAALSRWGVNYKEDYALFFTAEISEAVELSARNIKKLKILTPGNLNIYDVLRADKLIVTKSGYDYLMSRYSREEFAKVNSKTQRKMDTLADAFLSGEFEAEFEEGSEGEGEEVIAEEEQSE